MIFSVERENEQAKVGCMLWVEKLDRRIWEQTEEKDVEPLVLDE